MRLEEYDVVVVGGAAGAATARLLAGAGASVTLLCPGGTGDLVTAGTLAEPRIDLRVGAAVIAVHPDGTVDLTWRQRSSTIAADLVVVDDAQSINGRVTGRVVAVSTPSDAAALVQELGNGPLAEALVRYEVRTSRRGYA
jgi:2-polyprenyl-6-methoxyphenol hydroxylase-like FAD-dependent oxidoreductase